MAEQIEELAKEFLLPYPVGIYDPTADKPLVVPGQTYFKREGQVSARLVPVVVNSIDDITTDIYNANAERLVSYRIRSLLTMEPQFAVHGMHMIEHLVDCILAEYSAWLGSRVCTRVEDLWSKFLLPEESDNVALKISIHEVLSPISREVRSFIGADQWIMHFRRRFANDVMVEKTIDYRIYDWQRRTESGEWK